jgi:hypothetical protein
VSVDALTRLDPLVAAALFEHLRREIAIVRIDLDR